MAELQRVLYNILCQDLAASHAFYRQLCGLETLHESGWYIVLNPPGQQNVQIGLIDHVSEFTPRHAWGTHNGTFLTFVVEDVFETLERARELGVEIVEGPHALAYGQTRALIRDPDGLIIDISTPTAELAARDEIVAAGPPRTTAIDQDQPNDPHT